MEKIFRAGIVGTGMMGVLQAEALRRIPVVQIAAVTSRNLETAKSFCRERFIPHAYDNLEEMLEKEQLDVLHVCTPNNSHFEISKKALLSGVHVYCEKPLANSSEETEQLVTLAREKGLAAAVNFNYRHNAIVQDMHERVAGEEWGRTFFVHGRYIQDWLMYEDDYNWRCIPGLGGASRAVADIGSHWFDTVQFITGKKITRVFARLLTVHETRKQFETPATTFGKPSGDHPAMVRVDSEDAAFILVEFEDGTCGNAVVSQVSAGHKNDFAVNIDGSRYSMYWHQETPDRLLIGSRESGTTLIHSSPDTLHGSAIPYASLPGGHPVGWNDALTNAISQFYRYLREGGEPHFATFEDGHHIEKLLEACLESNRLGQWVDVK